MRDWSAFNDETLELYARASSGDVSARNKLWECVKPSLLKHYASFLRRLSLYEGDPLGFCYIAFHEALRLYDPERGTPFLPYCIRVLRYRLCTFAREVSERICREVTFSSVLDYDDSDVDPVDAEEETSSMLSVYSDFDEDSILTRITAEKLPPPVSLVAVMLIEGYTPIQIMESLRMSKSSYYRTRKLLRSMLEGLL